LPISLATSKQIIEKLNNYDYIVFGALNQYNIIGLSNDFYTKEILNKVLEQIHINIGIKPINSQRTLWIISKNDLNKSNIIV